jgi:glutathione S-transferase
MFLTFISSRLALNIKGIKHQTVWVEFPEIEKRFKELGVPPSEILPDGTPRYTVPAIHDPSTNTFISDSARIVEYLDRTYPETPRIIIPGTTILNATLEWAWRRTIFTLYPLLAPNVIAHMSPAASQKYEARFESRVNMSLQDFKNDKALHAKLWKDGEEAFTVANSWFKPSDGGERLGPWIMGDKLSFSDLIVGSGLAYIASCSGEESEEWKKFGTWNDERWKGLWEQVKPYAQVY